MLPALLILLLQVPLKLVSVCCQQPGVLPLIAHPFTKALRCLLWTATGWLLGLKEQNSLVESFLQQLQQSDLLLHVAAILSDATHSIWELQHTDTVASELASAAYIYQDDISETSSSDLQLQHRHVGQLLICMDNLHCHIEAVNYHSKGPRWRELFLPVALPALELSVLTAQHVSTCLELLPARAKSPPYSLWGPLSSASTVVMHSLCRC